MPNGRIATPASVSWAASWRNPSSTTPGSPNSRHHLHQLGLARLAELGRFWQGANASITLFVNNLLDNVDQLPSGYSYQFLVRDSARRDTLDGIPFYYPLATRNLVVSLDIDF